MSLKSINQARAMKAPDLSTSEPEKEFLRRPPTPFFGVGDPAGTGVTRSESEHVGTGNPVLGGPVRDADDQEGQPRAGRRIIREERLKGGIPVTQLVEALQKCQPPIAKGKREILNDVSRSIRIDPERWDSVEEIVGNRRDMAAWVRNAVMFAAEQRVAPIDMRAYAEVVKEGREKHLGRGRALHVGLGTTYKKIVEELARRSKMSEQQVLEACTELYRQVHLAVLEGEAVTEVPPTSQASA